MEVQNCFKVHLEMVKDGEIPYGEEAIDNPRKAAELAKQVLGNRDRECIFVCCTDTKKKPVCVQIAGMGKLSSCFVSIPEIFKVALLSNAAGIFLFHNHPSGDVTPTTEDKKTTEQVRKAGELLGIPLEDHIILGDGDAFCSLREKCWKAYGIDPFRQGQEHPGRYSGSGETF